MTETTKTKPRKLRKDVKLTADKLAAIEQCLKLNIKQDEVCKITQINRATIAAVKLVLIHLGRL